MECPLCARCLDGIMNRKEKVLVFGMYAFGDDVCKSKVASKNRRNPTFTGETG